MIRGKLALKPTFLIIGAQKAGTTSLFKYLVSHPKIVTPKQKELHFFEQDNAYQSGIDFYHSFFPLRSEVGPGQITCEATPYMHTPIAVERIHAYNPDLKLIVMLRNPVDRAFSQYQMYLRWQRENYVDKRLAAKNLLRTDLHKLKTFNAWVNTVGITQTFEELIDTELQAIHAKAPPVNEPIHQVIERGVYADQLERCFAFFPNEHILILSYREFVEKPYTILDQITDFLDLPRYSWDGRVIEKRYNVTKYTSELTQETRNRLHAFYQPHNARLFDLVGREFDWSD